MISWDEIRQKCPLLYQKEIVFECGRGWVNIIYDLSLKIEKILERISKNDEMYAVQVKEKFGALRFYMSVETNEIIDLIDEAETLSIQTCENCGKPAKIRGKRWLEVKCDECYKE